MFDHLSLAANISPAGVWHPSQIVWGPADKARWVTLQFGSAAIRCTVSTKWHRWTLREDFGTYTYYIHAIYMLYRRYIHAIYKLHKLYAHYIHTIYILYTYHIDTTYILTYILWLYKIWCMHPTWAACPIMLQAMVVQPLFWVELPGGWACPARQSGRQPVGLEA